MLALVTTLLVVAASPIPAVKLAAPGFLSVDVPEKSAAYLSDSFATQLAKNGLAVMTRTDLASVLGLERQKELIGCNEDVSCITELANALGVDGLLVGSVAHIGSTFLLNVKVISAADARSLAVWSARAPDDDGLVSAVAEAAPAIAAEVRRALHREAGVGSSGLRGPLVIGGVGVALGIAGGVMLGLSAQHLSTLESGTGVGGNVFAYADQGKTFRLAGGLLAGVGVAALVASLVWGALGSSAPAPVVTLVPGGASIGVAVVLP